MSTKTEILTEYELPNVHTVLTYVVYVAAITFFLFPVLWTLSISLRPRGTVITYPINLVPRNFTLGPYREVLLQSNIATWFYNSMKITFLEIVGILVSVTPAAYGFSRFDFRGRRALLVGILLFQMISPVVIVIPMYNMMGELGLLNSHLGLVLLYVGLQVPFSVWLLKSYFDTIPEELDQAARIDGCNRLQTLVYVLLPSMLPGFAVVIIFNFVFTWAEFVMAYTMLNSSKLFPIAVGIYSFQGQYTTAWRLIAAASIVAIVPIVIVFLALQKYFVRGLTEGAVKQ